MQKTLYIILAVLLLITHLAVAAEQDETVLRAKTESKLKQLAAKTNEVCGSSIAATVDWQSFASASWQRYSMASYCGAPLEVLADFCAQKKGYSKAYINKQVKSVTCAYGGKGKQDVKVEKGAITQQIDFDGANLKDFVRAALLKNM